MSFLINLLVRQSSLMNFKNSRHVRGKGIGTILGIYYYLHFSSTTYRDYQTITFHLILRHFILETSYTFFKELNFVYVLRACRFFVLDLVVLISFKVLNSAA